MPETIYDFNAILALKKRVKGFQDMILREAERLAYIQGRFRIEEKDIKRAEVHVINICSQMRMLPKEK